jgi:hypothetical protein
MNPKMNSWSWNPKMNSWTPMYSWSENKSRPQLGRFQQPLLVPVPTLTQHHRHQNLRPHQIQILECESLLAWAPASANWSMGRTNHPHRRAWIWAVEGEEALRIE